MGIFDSNKFKAVKTVWETPYDFFEPLNKEFNFTLDVAASDENKKVNRFFNKERDGLKQSWKDEVVWCNPPYGREVPKWLEKASVESKINNCTSVFLIPARTNTKWFHDICMNASEIRFVVGRPKFVGAKDGLPFPLMLVIFRPNNNKCKIGSYNWKIKEV